MKRWGKPPLVAEILVADDPEVPGPDRVRAADFRVADAALVAREAVEARHGEGDLVFVPALGRQVRERPKRGPDGLLLVARQPVPRRRFAAVHGGFGEHLLRIQGVEGRSPGPRHRVGPAPLGIDAW